MYINYIRPFIVLCSMHGKFLHMMHEFDEHLYRVYVSCGLW